MKQNKDTAIRSADIDLGFFDLNYAAEEEPKIPGIGSQMARAIIQHRPYREIEELVDKVPGINQENIDELTRAGASVGQPMKDKREFEERASRFHFAIAWPVLNNLSAGCATKTKSPFPHHRCGGKNRAQWPSVDLRRQHPRAKSGG